MKKDKGKLPMDDEQTAIEADIDSSAIEGSADGGDHSGAIDRYNVHGYAVTHRRFVLMRTILAVVLICVFAFLIAGSLVDIFGATGTFTTTAEDHDCTFSVEGQHIDGDCQTYGYTLYYCEVEGCTNTEKVIDAELGNCQYSGERLEGIDEDGNTYYYYICDICGKENRYTD